MSSNVALIRTALLSTDQSDANEHEGLQLDLNMFHCRRRRTGGGQTRLYGGRPAAPGFGTAVLPPRREPPQPDREGVGDSSVEQADHGRRRRRLRVPHEDDEERDEVRRRAHLGGVRVRWDRGSRQREVMFF